jgi:hypothetical protein
MSYRRRRAGVSPSIRTPVIRIDIGAAVHEKISEPSQRIGADRALPVNREHQKPSVLRCSVRRFRSEN